MAKARIYFVFVIALLAVTGGSLVMGGPGYLRAADDAAGITQDAGYTKVNVNAASCEELQAVRGIGPVIADRIVQFRDANGMFESLDDLAQVRGIGGSRFQQVKEQLTV